MKCMSCIFIFVYLCFFYMVRLQRASTLAFWAAASEGYKGQGLSGPWQVAPGRGPSAPPRPRASAKVDDSRWSRAGRRNRRALNQCVLASATDK